MSNQPKPELIIVHFITLKKSIKTKLIFLSTFIFYHMSNILLYLVCKFRKLRHYCDINDIALYIIIIIIVYERWSSAHWLVLKSTKITNNSSHTSYLHQKFSQSINLVTCNLATRCNFSSSTLLPNLVHQVQNLSKSWYTVLWKS